MPATDLDLDDDSDLDGLGTSLEDISGENDSDDEEQGELLDRVTDYVKKDNDEHDAEDGPDWMFENGELPSKDPEYVFCQAAHRKQILHLFTKHFCQHTDFWEWDGKQSAQDIRDNAVHEMYTFCRIRGLREVWGYMWACWYSPKMWRLWARSTSPYISRLRTTMNVENFWRQLKHDHLHHVTRPRLDQLVWILIHKVTPAYIARLESMNDEFRAGRSKELTTYQKYFKSSWRNLLKAKISNRKYDTQVKNWSCNCGRQKYDRHHLCKHLVQAVGNPSISFWREIYRRRKSPIYRHPELVEKGDTGIENSNTHFNLDGNITDGDDHVWMGDKQVLGGRGDWKSRLAADNLQKRLGKRKRIEDGDENNSSSANLESHKEPAKTQKLEVNLESDTPPEIIDLSMSSPLPSLSEPIPRTSFPIAYGSNDEEEVSV